MSSKTSTISFDSLSPILPKQNNPASATSATPSKSKSSGLLSWLARNDKDDKTATSSSVDKKTTEHKSLASPAEFAKKSKDNGWAAPTATRPSLG